MEKDSIIPIAKIFNPVWAYHYEHKLDPLLLYKRENKFLIIKEVGEYSIFVKDCLSEVKAIRLYQNDGPILQSVEILPSEKGSMIYFDKKVYGIIFPNTKIQFAVYRDGSNIAALIKKVQL